MMRRLYIVSSPSIEPMLVGATSSLGASALALNAKGVKDTPPGGHVTVNAMFDDDHDGPFQAPAPWTDNSDVVTAAGTKKLGEVLRLLNG